MAGALTAADCTKTSIGFTPLNDPFFVRPYQGMAGGLYPNRANRHPPAHEAAGLKLAADVRPRDSSGAVNDQNGRIVLLSAGMSNATQEFSAFQPLAKRGPDKNRRLVIVDGAQGGWSADCIVAGSAEYWATVDQRLSCRGHRGPGAGGVDETSRRLAVAGVPRRCARILKRGSWWTGSGSVREMSWMPYLHSPMMRKILSRRVSAAAAISRAHRGNISA